MKLPKIRRILLLNIGENFDMITNWKSLCAYIKADSRNYQRAIGAYGIWKHLGSIPTNDQYYIWKYLKTLRYYEYFLNKNRIWSRLIARIILLRLRKLSYKTGFQIPPNVLGKGVTIWHWGYIVINELAKLGDNCVLNPGIIIGHKEPGSTPPQIGNNVFVGAGAKIIGNITIGNNVTIAPNSSVVHDIPDNCVVAGSPAKIIKTKK